MLPITVTDNKNAQTIRVKKLPKTILTLVTTASTNPARRSHRSGTEKADTAKSRKATTAPETDDHSTKRETLAETGSASVSHTGTSPIM